MEIKLWVLGGLVSCLFLVVVFFGKQAFTIIKNLLAEMLAEMKKLTGTSIAHEERLKVVEQRGHDHEKRIRKMEDAE